MPTSNPNKGILQYLPQILSIAGLVGAAGMFYGQVDNAFTKINNLEQRQDRQLEIIQRLEGRIIDLEKRTEYYKGLRDGRTEISGAKRAE